MTIEELAVKHDASISWNKEWVYFSMNKLKAFADECQALNSSEPFGYWHVGNQHELSNFYLEKHDATCYQCINLYKANPINQELVEALTWMVTIHDDAEARMYDGGTTRAKVRELLKKANAAIPKPLKELK